MILSLTAGLGDTYTWVSMARKNISVQITRKTPKKCTKRGIVQQMRLRVNVLEEDIRDAEHDTCDQCLIGRAVSRALKSTVFGNYAFTVCVQLGKSGDVQHERVVIWNGLGSYYFALLPSLVAKIADSWESRGEENAELYEEGAYVDHFPGMAIRPFNFCLEFTRK